MIKIIEVGFIYIWYDRKHKKYYIGSHSGPENDGYICSSFWVKQAYKKRPEDFKRRILEKHYNVEYKFLLQREEDWLQLIKPEELRKRYYNIHRTTGHWTAYADSNLSVRQKISKTLTGRPVNFKDPIARGRKISETKKAVFQKNLEENGSKFSEEHRQNISSSTKGRKHSQEWKDANGIKLSEQWSNGTRNRSETSERTKRLWAEGKFSQRPRKVFNKYEVKFPDGTVHIIDDLVTFSKENNLTHSNMLASLKGRIKQHKGYVVLKRL